MLALTDSRLLAHNPDTGVWRSWPLHEAGRPALSLRHFDHAGVATLELHSGGNRLYSWRFTLAANVQALRLIKLFDKQTALDDGKPNV